MWPTRLLIWSTFYFLWSISNRSGMYCARSLTKIAAYAPSGEHNDYGLFLLFDNLKILLSTVSSFEEAETITCPLRMLIRQLIDCGLLQKPFSYSPQTLGITKISLMWHQS